MTRVESSEFNSVSLDGLFEIIPQRAERYQLPKKGLMRAKNGVNKAMGLGISNLDVGMQQKVEILEEVTYSRSLWTGGFLIEDFDAVL